MKGNKGEWSEIYALLKLLGDKEVYVGDENINRIPELLYPIVKIIRDESGGHFEYSVNDEIIIINSEEKDVFSIPVSEFKNQSLLLLEKIKKANTSSFEIPELEEFLSKINCNSLTASSSVKTDIRIVIHDLKTNQEPELGFSIKSQLGGASTLLNAGKTTNFVYKIIGDIDIDFMEELNFISSRSKIKDRINRLLSKDISLEFSHTEREIFGNNLVLIDSLLPNILAQIVLSFYSSNLSKIKDIIEVIEKENPLSFNVSNNHKYYEYKIKKLLSESALGMMPSKVWNGLYDATGGYLVVKENGEVLSYHIYNRNKFENYLFNNTKLDTASSSRHQFGTVYQNEGSYFLKLNLQIRFIK